MSNVPKLRFKEFSGEWEEKKLGELFKINVGGDVDSSNVSSVKTNIFKYPIYANAEKDKGFYGYCDVYKASENVITVAGRGINLGIAHARDHKFYPIVRLLVLTPIKEQNIYFFEYRINNMNLLLESTGVPQLTAPQLSMYKIKFSSLQEQEKIASFLSAIDTKIEQLTKKEALLQEYKKGVMQKIFSQELRFKADDGSEFPEWEEKKFENILKSISTKSYQIKNSDILEKGNFKVIDQGQKDIAGFSNDDDKLFKNNEIIVYGDHTTIIKYVDFDFIIGADGTKLLTKIRNDNLKYVYYNLVYNNIEPEGYKRHFSILKNITLQLPCLEEQTKIANFLSSIDKKIELISKEIEKAKEFKKGLLQQMFV